MSKGKKVAVIINHSPFSGNFCEEGLRAAAGMGQSQQEHSMKLFLIGDGVWFGLKNSRQHDFLKYIMALKAIDMEMILEQESLDNRKIKTGQLVPDFKVLPRAEILKMIKISNHVITY